MGSRGGGAYGGDGAVVGADILDVVTSGMYVDPRAVYREYVQNAVDAIEDADLGAEGVVEIGISPDEGSVRIRDNGPGVARDEVEGALVAIARSKKRGGRLRGFRGIGRLAGLAFAESVTFLTRAGEGSPIVRVVWDRAALSRGMQRGDSLSGVLEATVEIDMVQRAGYPARFFEVRLNGVSRHAAGTIMNREVVRQYVAEVCPVAFGKEFRYGTEVLRILDGEERPQTVRVCFEDEDGDIRRPHGCSVRTSERDGQEITGIEEVRIPGIGERELAAVGWIGHTQYQGAILKSCGVRGVRARVGNMQIGGEDVFEHLFSEDRFNRWCIGEIHVLERGIVPNARRDYFEPGVHLRNLENQLGAVCRGLERRCRAASRERLRERRLRDFVTEAERTLDLALSGYLSAETAGRLVERKASEAADWQGKRAMFVEDKAGVERLEEIAERLAHFRAGRACGELKGVGPGEAGVYREVFGVLSEVLADPAVARRVIEAVLDWRERYQMGAVSGTRGSK